VVVDMIDMSATASDRARRAAASHELWKTLPTVHAVRTNRVYAAANDALLVPGPRVVTAAEWLAALIREPVRP
jgi:ABC-type Fe3+-hydroxamate transport system substrate-binding protein